MEFSRTATVNQLVDETKGPLPNYKSISTRAVFNSLAQFLLRDSQVIGFKTWVSEQRGKVSPSTDVLASETCALSRSAA